MSILTALLVIALSGLALAFAFGLFIIWVINNKWPEQWNSERDDIFW